MKRRQNFQTISWFYDVYKRGLMDLNPPYQRRSVWNQSYKDYFIDTILLDYPAPAIFVYEHIDEKGLSNYFVVDGKQRLMTIFDFVQNEFPVDIKATKSKFRERYFSDFSGDEKNEVWSYTFLVEYLPTNEEEIINNIFDRINRNVARLTPQELRHAKYSGIFISKVEELSDWFFDEMLNSMPRITQQSRKQMKEVEYVAQLFLAIEIGPRGYSTIELDEEFSNRDDNWEDEILVINNFKATTTLLKRLIQLDDNYLIKSRYKNQADFYSLFCALNNLRKRETIPSDDFIINVLRKIEASEVEQEKDQRLITYFEHVKSASNRTKARKERIEIIEYYLLNDKL
jgi:hypothetical protein